MSIYTQQFILVSVLCSNVLQLLRVSTVAAHVHGSGVCVCVCVVCAYVFCIVDYYCLMYLISGVNTLSSFYSKDTLKDVKKLDIRPDMLEV